MTSEETPETTQRLTQLAPAVRGLLAEKTDDPDNPCRPVVLEMRAGEERADEGTLEVDPPGADESEEGFRAALASVIEEFGGVSGAKPNAVCVRGLGTFAVVEDEAEAGLPLHNKVAVVTGAAGAIGHGVCRGLLENGCRVAATDLPGEALDGLPGEFGGAAEGRIIAVPMDVTDEQSVSYGFSEVVRRWGGVDIVIVNAGIAHVCSLMEMDPEDFRKLERVNMEGTLLTIAEGGRIMVRQGTGGDVVVISTKNVFAPGARFGAYSATKAGSHQLARIASLELAEFGIRVNMVAPDAVFSDGSRKSGLWAAVGPDRMRARGLDEKGLEEYYRNRNLLKARVTARHVANAVLFFVTHQTPTTGATIPVDGGLPDATPR